MEIIKLDFPAKLLYHYEKQKDVIFFGFLCIFLCWSNTVKCMEQHMF